MRNWELGSMDDELEGWKRVGACSFQKRIGGHRFIITPTGAEFILSIENLFSVATRPSLDECQYLAHATDRLWAGEDK